MHELKRTIHRIGVSRSSRPTVYLLCRSSYYSTSTCVHRHQQKPSVEQSIPLMHSEKTIGNAPIKLLSQNSHIAVGNFGNRPSERSDRSTPRQTTHRGATASHSSRTAEKALPPSTPFVYSDELPTCSILPRTNTWVYRCQYWYSLPSNCQLN